MVRVLRGALITLVAASALFSAGCSKGGEAATTNVDSPKPASVAPPGTVVGKQSNAATPDVNLYPAPSGVKTGLEGGRK